MHDSEKVISWVEGLAEDDWRLFHSDSEVQNIAKAVLALLKEQEELLHKLQKDKDKLCLEISGWKHKFHDAPPKFVSQGVVDQICWERDTALSQLEEIGKGLGSKMDDIVALLKEQETVPVYEDKINKCECGETICRYWHPNFCGFCGRKLLWY